MNGLRSLWKRNHDLELRLWQPELQSRGNSAPVAPIVLEDDDDDVQVSSPRSFARTSNLVAAASNRFTIINGGVLEHQQTSNSMSTQCDRFSVISERDLELRLGFAGTTSIQRMRPLGNHNGHREHNQTPSKDPIDLTLVNDECQLVGSITSKKRKHAPSVGGNEIKLACAICMDSMKEETSTICGHIFCKKCITASIQVQKKCPTCRRKLTMSNIHRIYLSSNVS